MIIGLCGKSCSGKSTLSRLLMEKYNAIHLDIDKIGHKVLTLEVVKEELESSFGKSIFNSDIVDRKKLGNLVFSSRDKMSKLTDITWKYMQIEIDKFLKQHKDKIIILDWLLLPKTKYFNMCDIKILLDIPYSIRLQRALIRDNITKESFDLRENSSIEFDYNSFDYVFSDNNIDIERLIKK